MISTIYAWIARVAEFGDHAPGGLGIWPYPTLRRLKVQVGSMTASIDGSGESSQFVPRRPAVAEIPATPSLQSHGLSPEPVSFKPPRRRILIVDDNIDAARSLAKVLTLLHGQNVEIAHDGPSALKAAEAFRPQIVLLDIGLPGMSGHEVAEQLRRKPWFVGGMLVAVTGWGTGEGPGCITRVGLRPSPRQASQSGDAPEPAGWQSATRSLRHFAAITFPCSLTLLLVMSAEP